MKNQAFTLIELLVVVLIIGILAAIAVPQYQKAVMRSRFTKMILYNDSIVKAQNAYFLANGHYATSLDDLDITLPEGHGCWMNVTKTLTYTNCILDKGDKHFAILQKVLIPQTPNRTDCCTYSDTNNEADYLCSAFANTNEYTGNSLRCFSKYN